MIDNNVIQPSLINASRHKVDRLTLYEKNIIQDFNSYRNWDTFAIPVEPYDAKDPQDAGKYLAQSTAGIGIPGTKSLFNNVHAVRRDSIDLNDPKWNLENNAPLLDTPENRKRMRERNGCTIKELCTPPDDGDDTKRGRGIYNYADFMYCKYLGQISNNYLLTLRRFPVPCGDYITNLGYIDKGRQATAVQQHMPDVGRLVTWLGTPGNDMSSILKYTVKMPFAERTAKLEDNPGYQDNGGPLAQIMNCCDSTYQRQVQAGISGAQFNATFAGIPGVGKMMGDPPYTNAQWRGFIDNNKVYGPVDAIKKTHVRGDQGLEFNQNITLTFDYELRSYDGINGKAAMLDLLGNILAVTYSTGTFWGGGYRSTGSHQSNVFANLPIFKAAERGELNSFSGIQDAFFNTVNYVKAEFSKNQKSGNPLDQLKDLAGNFAGMLLGSMLNKLGRPQKLALQSLLTPASTGFWHLTVGNPNNPIMSIGNLIIDNCEIEHYGPLGLDDFPTGLKVTVTLKHGKSRDTSQIEQMYVFGDSRIYTSMGQDVEVMYKRAKMYKKKNPTDEGKRDAQSSDAIIAKAATSTARINDEIENKTLSAGKAGELAVTTCSPPSNPEELYETGTLAYMYQKFFGTKNVSIIKNAAKETAYGMNKKKRLKEPKAFDSSNGK